MLQPGGTLGHYRIAEKIGEGGMGQVWRATDTVLGRDVAIKILPPEVADNAERIARFEREAQLLASLNHAGIAAVHGLHEAGGVRFLAMELVPGEDLAARIAAGVVPLGEALDIARQIAEALEAAHEQGIVHRDLKPANVKVTPGGKVKLLDFGLAKALDPMASGTASASMAARSPTLTMNVTLQGIILGTAAYMAPEQAAGSAVDRRADVWAFGVILYEMLAGRRLFVGETVSHVLASVLKDEPDFGALPESVPARVRELMRRCLRKKPRERLQAIGDARIVLEEALAGATDETAVHAAAGTAGGFRPWHVAAAAAVALALGASSMWWLGRAPAAQAPPRTVSDIILPNGMLVSALQLSPDGSTLAFVGREGSEATWRIWVRGLASQDLRQLPGTDAARGIVWSPDGHSIAFPAGSQLKRVDLEGGQPIRLTNIDGFSGGAWAKDAIVYSVGRNHGLMRIPPTGGEPVELTHTDGASSHVGPSLIDGGPRLFYTSMASSGTTGRVHLMSLEGGGDRDVMPTESHVEFSNGRIYYQRDTALLAKRFEPSTGAVGGEDAELIMRGVDPWGGGTFSLARGLLVFLPRGETEGSRITIYGRDGKVKDAIDTPTYLDDLTISRDGKRAAVAKFAPNEPNAIDVWTVDLDRKMLSRATFGDADDDPVFSPDGAKIAFAHDGDLFVRPANGSGEPALIVDSKHDIVACDWAQDGTIVYTDIEDGMDELFAVPATGGKPRRLTTTPFREMTPQISPDGRWLAYTSTESGDAQIYVARWPALDGKWRVSKESAAMPRWGGDSRGLYFLSRDRKIFRATIAAGAGEPALELPEELFHTNYAGNYTARNSRWAVSPDGSSFLVLEAPPGKEARTTSITLVTQP
jgi:Tol biopolymer transport system component